MLSKILNKKLSPTTIVIIILILILICSFVLFFEVNEYRTITSIEEDFYSYYTTERIDFKATIMKDINNNTLDLKSQGVYINSTPLYYANDESQMLLPTNMEIVYPYKSFPMYKVGNYSKIYIKNKYIYMNSVEASGRLYDCFLYDGNDLYVFVEDTTLVMGEEKYQLSPMSFAEITKGYIKYYDKKTSNYVFIDNYEGKVEAYTEEYVIDLKNDTFTYDTAFYMLMKNVDGLDHVKF